MGLKVAGFSVECCALNTAFDLECSFDLGCRI